MSNSDLRPKTASEGMILTNGETYSDVGGTIYLGVNDDEKNWYEITEAEYEQIQAEEQARMEIEIQEL